jgi:hypothetical protein
MRVKCRLRMLPDRSPRQRGRSDTLHKILRGSGHYRRTLHFNSKKQRLNFLIELFKPYSTEVTGRGDKHSITTWLKKQGLTDWEVQRFYLETGIPSYRLKRTLKNVCGSEATKPITEINPVNSS